jgi:hypothetical protein
VNVPRRLPSRREPSETDSNSPYYGRSRPGSTPSSVRHALSTSQGLTRTAELH